MRALLLMMGMSMLMGCVSHPQSKPDTPLLVKENNKPAKVNRTLTLAWDNIGRGGAAMRKPGYIHVLGDGKVGEAQNKMNDAEAIFSAESNQKGDVNETLNAFKSLTKGQGYSLYELSRWERYCNRGKGMDERDWRFIEAEGAEHIPSEIVVGCSPPAYTYQEYLSAWIAFCASKTITEADRLIVRSSVRPFSVVNPCKALLPRPSEKEKA
jgi:hypothetical protein